MRCKLLRSDVCMKFGKFYKKKFYEYGLHNKEDLNKISENHTKKVQEILLLKEANPKKYMGLAFPKLLVPEPSSQDVKECLNQHTKEKIFEVVKKHNNNIQIFVDTPEEVPTEQPIVDEDNSNTVKRGRPFKNG